MFNGSYNAWEYYFEPVSDLRYKPGDPINQIYEAQYTKFSYLNMSQQKRNEAYQMINRYIKIKPIVQQKIDKFYSTYMLGKKTIGIHLRGTDKCIEHKLVSSQTIAQEALKYVDNDTQFLIATDEKKLFNQLINLLKGYKIIYYDCYRSEDGKPLHFRKPSQAQLDEDVIIEMLLCSV